MAQEIDLGYRPQPKQRVLHTTGARLILYGGAAGGGKSRSIRADAVAACLDNPGCQAFLFRRTLPELEQNHITPIRSELPESLGLGRYNGTRNRFEFANGSMLNFAYCENAGDEWRYHGAEMHWLGVDEAALFGPEQLTFLLSRVRLGSFDPREPELLPRIVYASNPGGPSHQYLKQIFIDGRTPETVFTDPETRMPAIFIPAKIEDNTYIDPSYALQFSRMSKAKQRMYRDGDWNVVAGAFFDCFETGRHVIRPFQVPHWWVKFRAIDWGHATPFSIGWWAVSDGSEVERRDGSKARLPAGALVKYREWYGCQPDAAGRITNAGLRMDGAQVAEKIKSMTDEQVHYTVADPSMWRVDSGPSQAEKMARAGVPCIRADNQREAGWQEMYQRMVGEDGEPMLYVFDRCTAFIETVPMLLADEKNFEDVVKGSHDHVGDESRYACMSRPWKRDRPEEPVKKTGWEFMSLVEQAKRMRRRESRI